MTDTKVTEDVLCCAVQVMERWLVNPYPGQTGILSPKEAILMVQRLAALEKLNLFDTPGSSTAGGQQGAGAQQGGSGAGGSSLKKAWDSTLLSLVLRLSTPPPEAQVGPGQHALVGAGGGPAPLSCMIPLLKFERSMAIRSIVTSAPLVLQPQGIEGQGCGPGVAVHGAMPRQHLPHCCSWLSARTSSSRPVCPWQADANAPPMSAGPPSLSVQDVDRLPEADRDRVIAETRRADEYFLHLERRFMMGLRATDHDMRR